MSHEHERGQQETAAEPIRGLLDHCHAQWLALAGRWGKITMQTTMNRSSTIDAL